MTKQQGMEIQQQHLSIQKQQQQQIHERNKQIWLEKQQIVQETKAKEAVGKTQKKVEFKLVEQLI